MVDEVDHFIGGKRVKGQSGRFADVFWPMTGEVAARVPLASAEDVRTAVEDAKAAQPAWAAKNPQVRARVMMKFIQLVNDEKDDLALMLAREHGKTIPDAHGDIQRGVEVCEFAVGIPHLLKGEFSEGVGPGIDMFSVRQPLGVVAGITPFNFPAMIPMWKFAPAIACGNAFILKPSERDPGVPMRLAELMIEAGLPAGILNVVNGDKVAVDGLLDDPDIQAVGFVGSSAIAEYIYSRGCANGKRVQAFAGAKNHMIIMPDADMDQAVDALIGAGYGSAGERCMAISVAVPVGKQTADKLVEKLVPRVEALKIGPSTDLEADFGPVVTAEAAHRIKDYVQKGVDEGADLLVDGRSFKMQGYEDGFYVGGCLFDNVTKDMTIYKEEIFGPVLSVVRANDYEEGLALATDHQYGNGVAIYTRDGDAARDFSSRVQVGMVGVNVPIPVPLAYHTFGGWKRSGFGDLNQH
ncbi:MAG: CoA-acylating methylmalonate-semialdehyde dehydrogenase, partial [Pseudomonadota bacterium]